MLWCGSGDVIQGVSLFVTLGAGRCIPHPFAPLSSPHPRLVAPSIWKKARQPHPNGFSGTCQRSREREQRTCSFDRLRLCPFEPGSRRGGQDGHFAGSCPSVVLGQTSDAREQGEKDVHQTTHQQRQAP